MRNTYFHDIDLYLITELMKANVSIKAAVAWCTDKKILRALSVVMDRGVELTIIVNDDKINRNVDYSPITSKGAQVLYSSGVSDIMHQKFCVIDDEVVVHGTYNWTNNAKKNDESITVTDDVDAVNGYLNEFDRLLLEIEERCQILACSVSQRQSKQQGRGEAAQPQRTTARLFDSEYAFFEPGKQKESRVTRTFTLPFSVDQRLTKMAALYGTQKSVIIERAFTIWADNMDKRDKVE